MKNRKEMTEMLDELKDRYVYNRDMVLHNTTDINSFAIITDEDVEIVTPETTANALKDFVHSIYSEYDWDDEAECILDDIWSGIDAMLEYYKMMQPTETAYDDNGVDNGMRMINIYKIQGFISDIDGGITAIKGLIKMVETEE